MIDRRDVLKTASLTALSYSRVLGANDRIGLGVIGVGNRGSGVMASFQKNPDVEVRAICDVWGDRTDKALSKAPGAKGFADHRKLLERTEVDAVLVATPDHWHKDHSTDCMEAGKDVYCEKPMCRTRDEAPMMVRAARSTKRVLQIGVQQRSGTPYLESRDLFLKTGALGRITHIDAIWHGGPSGAGRPQTAPARPDNLDWIRFLGKVPYRDWAPAQYFNFRAFLDFNGGKMTDFGHHWMDAVHMFMGERAPVSAVFAGGNFFPHSDGRTAPDTCNALFEYDAGFTVMFQSNAYPSGAEYGITFYGDKGKLFVNRNRYEFTPAGLGAQAVGKKIPGDITLQHVRNFLDCVKSRQLPNGDCALAAVSIVAPLLAVESYIARQRLRFDPDRMEVVPS
ncbi:MAG: Gfo/Idh/MocA family oxidoreductase [Bryobacteraceae bacterium]|nr:Gfo/Idh/MocA family oxidoreductase [Bryobacteraceae bacterium]